MRKAYLIGGVICTLLCVLCIYMALPARPTNQPDVVKATAQAVTAYSSAVADSAAPAKEQNTSKVTPPVETRSDPAPSDATVPDETPREDPAIQAEPQGPPYVAVAGYESPVDFASLQAFNSDIYAWITIGDTNINNPLFQSLGRRSFYYFNHNIYKKGDINGSLYTDWVYNGQDFMDPVTVIYGHDMLAGDAFGRIQRYYGEENALEKYGKFTVFQPDCEHHYQVFACVPFKPDLLFYTYQQFATEEDVEAFLRDVRGARGLEAVFDDSLEVTGRDKLLVFSTCLRRDRTQRYLVVAKLVETVGAPKE